MPLDEIVLIWVVPLAVALHNLEEAIWLPDWSGRAAGRWHRPVGKWQFRFAVSVLTAGVIVIAAGTQLAGWASAWHYFLAAYALGQGLNIFVPHLIATIATRSYAPGLLSGALLVLPAAAALLTTSFTRGQLARGQLQPGRFILTAALFIPGMLVSIPILFWIGKAIQPGR